MPKVSLMGRMCQNCFSGVRSKCHLGEHVYLYCVFRREDMRVIWDGECAKLPMGRENMPRDSMPKYHGGRDVSKL